MTRIEREHIMDYVFEFVTKSDLDSAYFEFNLYKGTSVIRAYHSYQKWIEFAKKQNKSLKEHPLYLLDSFKGLPEFKQENKLQGYTGPVPQKWACSEEVFKKNLKNHSVPLHKLHIYKGFLRIL